MVSRAAELAELVEGFNMEPRETEPQEIVGELQHEKAKAQKIANPLLTMNDVLVVEKAFEMMREIEETSHGGQRRICCSRGWVFPRRAQRPTLWEPQWQLPVPMPVMLGVVDISFQAGCSWKG